jgi:seryl-tRNA synthetase
LAKHSARQDDISSLQANLAKAREENSDCREQNQRLLDRVNALHAERDKLCADHKAEEQNRDTIRSLEEKIQSMAGEISTLQALVSETMDQRDNLANRLRQVLASSAPAGAAPETIAGPSTTAIAAGATAVSSSSTSSASDGSDEEGAKASKDAAADEQGAAAPEEAASASEHASPKLDSDVEAANAAA